MTQHAERGRKTNPASAASGGLPVDRPAPVGRGVAPSNAAPLDGLAFDVRRAVEPAPSDPLGGTPLPAETLAALVRRRGAGRPLPDALAVPLGEAMGADFGGVRVHADGEADRISRSVQASAFTHGQDIYFTQGAYAPDSTGGRQLLAHELAHVVQNQTAHHGSSSSQTTIGHAADPAETAADGAAAAALSLLQRRHEPTATPTELSTPGARPALSRLRRHHAAGVIRRREINPYSTGQSHDGWTLTGHHIIGHAKLVEAARTLSADQRNDIYIRSIPQVLTQKMLELLKVTLPDYSPDALAAVRARLADPADTGEIGGQRIQDVRESFYEWQQGNQYAGPNTSIRTEPVDDKADMDRDGRYFAPRYEELEAEGDGLYGDLKKHRAAKTDEARAAIALEIHARLQRILAITANQANAAFNPTDWTEITSLDEVERLASNPDLGRKHLRGYAYFVLPLASIGQAPYEDLQPRSGGEYTYGGKKVAGSIQGTKLFVKIVDAEKHTAPPTEAEKTLQEVLTDLQLPVTDGDDTVDVTVPAGNRAGEPQPTVFRIKGYNALPITYTRRSGDVFTVPKSQLAEKIKVKGSAGKSLYAYFQEKKTPTSTYLPKGLYDAVTVGIPALETLVKEENQKVLVSQQRLAELESVKEKTQKQEDEVKEYTAALALAQQSASKYQAELTDLRTKVTPRSALK